MRKHRASKRYASALFSLSREEKVVDIVEKNMIEIGDILKNNPDLMRLFESPDASKKEKEQIVESIFKPHIHQIVFHLLQLLLVKNRELLIPEIVEWYQELVDDYHKILRAELITPVKLDVQQKEKISKLFEEKIRKKVVFIEKVDSSILGGFIVKTADKIFDASIKSELKRLHQTLVSAEFN